MTIVEHVGQPAPGPVTTKPKAKTNISFSKDKQSNCMLVLDKKKEIVRIPYVKGTYYMCEELFNEHLQHLGDAAFKAFIKDIGAVYCKHAAKQ
jgi:hypothetical protein